MEGAGGAGRMNFGREITGVDLKRSEVLRLLNLWSSRPSVKTLASEWLFPPISIKNFCATGVRTGFHDFVSNILSGSHGLGDDYLFRQAFVSFRKFCMDPSALPDDLYVLISGTTEPMQIILRSGSQFRLIGSTR